MDGILTDSQIALEVPPDVPVLYLDVLSTQSIRVTDAAKQRFPAVFEAETMPTHDLYLWFYR